MNDQELIKRLREGATWDDDIAAADRIEELIKEVERRIEPEQVEKLVMLADPIMSEIYAVECSYRQEAEAKLTKVVEAIKQSIKEWESPHYGDEDIKINNGVTGFYLLRTVLAELEVMG